MSWKYESDFPLSAREHQHERYLFFHPHHGLLYLVQVLSELNEMQRESLRSEVKVQKNRRRISLGMLEITGKDVDL